MKISLILLFLHPSFEFFTSSSLVSHIYNIHIHIHETSKYAHSKTHTLTYTCLHPHSYTHLMAQRGLTDRDCWVIQANMIDFMITLKPQLVFMLSRNAKSFQHKSGRESGMKGTRGRKTLQLLHFRAHLPPFLLPPLFPLGTFNGIKLWACKSDNNCLGLKHNTLTGVTRPFSSPPLVLRCGHLLCSLKNQPRWQAIVVRRHFLCDYPLTF